jgi:hypothetical protein
LKDPHCGTNGKEYDNGCFFLCAQQREKGQHNYSITVSGSSSNEVKLTGSLTLK